MSERYNPRKLKREWIARLAAGERPLTTADRIREESIRQTEFEQRMRARTLRGAPVVVHCNHGMSWLDCRICSKPRSGR